jgi:hypothetical protein
MPTSGRYFEAELERSIRLQVVAGPRSEPTTDHPVKERLKIDRVRPLVQRVRRETARRLCIQTSIIWSKDDLPVNDSVRADFENELQAFHPARPSAMRRLAGHA